MNKNVINKDKETVNAKVYTRKSSLIIVALILVVIASMFTNKETNTTEPTRFERVENILTAEQVYQMFKPDDETVKDKSEQTISFIVDTVNKGFLQYTFYGTDIPSSDLKKNKSLAQGVLFHNMDFHSINARKPFASNTKLMEEFENQTIEQSAVRAFDEYYGKVFIPTFESDSLDIWAAPVTAEGATTNKNVKVTKVYRYSSVAGQESPTYMMFTTEATSNLFDILNEREFNNFQLKEWFTSAGAVATEDTSQAQTVPTYESLKQLAVPIRTGTEPEKIELSSDEKELYLLYEYEPIVNQINLIILSYTGQGIRAQESQIEYPINGVLDSSSIPGLIIGARYSTSIVPAFIENWDGTQGMQPLEIESNGNVKLVPEASTVYLNTIERDLLER